MFKWKYTSRPPSFIDSCDTSLHITILLDNVFYYEWKPYASDTTGANLIEVYIPSVFYKLDQFSCKNAKPLHLISCVWVMAQLVKYTKTLNLLQCKSVGTIFTPHMRTSVCVCLCVCACVCICVWVGGWVGGILTSNSFGVKTWWVTISFIISLDLNRTLSYTM